MRWLITYAINWMQFQLIDKKYYTAAIFEEQSCMKYKAALPKFISRNKESQTFTVFSCEFSWDPSMPLMWWLELRELHHLTESHWGPPLHARSSSGVMEETDVAKAVPDPQEACVLFSIYAASVAPFALTISVASLSSIVLYTQISHSVWSPSSSLHPVPQHHKSTTALFNQCTPQHM